MNTKDLCATMVDSATGLNSAMEVYGFLKEELYQYLSMDPSMDAQKNCLLEPPYGTAHYGL